MNKFKKGDRVRVYTINSLGSPIVFSGTVEVPCSDNTIKVAADEKYKYLIQFQDWWHAKQARRLKPRRKECE